MWALRFRWAPCDPLMMSPSHSFFFQFEDGAGANKSREGTGTSSLISSSITPQSGMRIQIESFSTCVRLYLRYQCTLDCCMQIIQQSSFCSLSRVLKLHKVTFHIEVKLSHVMQKRAARNDKPNTAVPLSSTEPCWHFKAWTLFPADKTTVNNRLCPKPRFSFRCSHLNV